MSNIIHGITRWRLEIPNIMNQKMYNSKLSINKINIDTNKHNQSKSGIFNK